MNVKQCARVLICTIVFPSLSMAWSFKGIYNSLFTLFPEERREMVQRQFNIEQNGLLEIHNDRGDITVQTKWDQGSIVIEAIKRAKKADDLAALEIYTDAAPDKVLVQSIAADDGPDGVIDYNIIVPGSTVLHLGTHKGNINIQDASGNVKLLVGTKGNITATNTSGALSVDTQSGSVKIVQAHGPVKARAFSGNINIEQAEGVVIAETLKSGNIYVVEAQQAVRAKTKSGNISIHPACADIIATAQRGNIDIICKDMLSTSKISANTQRGNINVHLPEKMNAYLDAQTERGTIASGHPITLKTKTTTLDKKAWHAFKREVQGYIGGEREELVSIQLRSARSNINIKMVAADQIS